jgi:uncharacterized protein
VLAVDELIGEGERVVALARGKAKTIHGLRYDNEHAFVFRGKDGKITEVAEYLDTVLVESAAYGKRLVGAEDAAVSCRPRRDARPSLLTTIGACRSPWPRRRRRSRLPAVHSSRPRTRSRENPQALRDALDEVRRIADDVLSSSGARVILFGSAVSGRFGPLSDIDVAVDPVDPLPPGLLSRFRERLEESHVPYRVDVVDLSATDPAFRERVLAEGVRWSG